MMERREGLEAHHRAALHARGLTDATIAANGLRSEVNAQHLAGIMRWKRPRKKLVPAIVIPFVGPAGCNGYYRCRPDVPATDRNGKAVKYESPPGEPNRVYFPAGVIDYLHNERQEIALTEGEFKSLAINQELLPALGLVGVWGWKPKDHQRLLPELEGVAWNGRKVYLIPDSDFGHKEGVQAAFAWLAKHLRDRGAVVKLVRLPDAEDGSKLGADDFLAKHGTDGKGELRKLLDNAEEPPAIDPERVKGSAEQADPAKEAAAILNSSKAAGKLRTRSYRGEVIYWTAGKYEAIPQSDIEAQVMNELNLRFFGVKQSHVSNTVAQIKAQSVIYSRVTPPAWIGQGSLAFDPEQTIVAKNGIVDLAAFSAGKECLRPATPDFFTFTALDYDFDPKSPTPVRWLAFLNELWPGDEASISTLQEWTGYVLVNWTSLQKILCVIGPRRAGKGVISRVLRSVIGEGNVGSPTLSSLSGDYGLWALLDKSAAFITDARLSGRTDSAVVVERLLNISGEDSIDVPRKYLETLKSVKLPARITLFSNELPALNDSSGALSGRLIVLRLRESFYGRENPGLTDQLLTERAGILLWGIEGWARLRKRGYFVQPESARELVDQMEELASPVALFVKDCCDLDPAASVSVSGMYKAWCWWCEQHGREPSTSQIFGRNLSAAVSTIKRTQPRDGGARHRAYEGIGLTDEAWFAINGSPADSGGTSYESGSSERDGTRAF